MQTRLLDRIKITAHWRFEAFRPDPLTGLLTPLWDHEFDNLVVDEGRNSLLGNTFDAVPGSVAWHVGLIGANTGTVAITSAAAAITGTSTSFQATDVGSDVIIVGAGAAGLDLITTILSRSTTTAAVANANAGTTQTVAAYAIEPRPLDVMATKSFNELTAYSEANRQTWTKNGAPSAGAMSNSASKARFTINANNTSGSAYAFADFQTDIVLAANDTLVINGATADPVTTTEATSLRRALVSLIRIFASRLTELVVVAEPAGAGAGRAGPRRVARHGGRRTDAHAREALRSGAAACARIAILVPVAIELVEAQRIGDGHLPRRRAGRAAGQPVADDPRADI